MALVKREIYNLKCQRGDTYNYTSLERCYCGKYFTLKYGK